MKASRFSDAQKAFILKQGADGMPVADICRKAGISQATYFNWKRKYDGLLPTEMRRLKQLEDENSKLRKVVAAEEKSAKWSAVACNEEGVPNEGAKAVEKTTEKDTWDTDYAKPSETAVKLTVAAGDYVCDVFKSKDEKTGTETTEWISEGALVKLVKKTKSGEPVLEAIQIVMK